MALEITETLYVKDRNKWRAWLEKNHDSKKEIWLIYYKKHTKKPAIPYDDSVEEALCFGWIDGILKRIDDEKFTRRFTPRRKDSIWSDINMERASKMKKEGKMTKIGLAQMPKKGEKGRLASNRVIPKKLSAPPELEKALASNPKAQKNWDKFAPSHRKMYIYWITDAKRPETVQRRIMKVVRMAEENKKTMM